MTALFAVAFANWIALGLSAVLAVVLVLVLVSPDRF